MEKVNSTILCYPFLLLGSALGCALAQTSNLPSDYDTRVVVLEDARRANPESLSTLRALADSYGMGAQYDKAIEVVQKVLTLDVDNPEFQLRLARLHLWSGKPQQALTDLHQLGPRGGVEAEELECQILNSTRRAHDATSCYQRLLAHLPAETSKIPGALLALARNQSWAGRGGDAVRSYEKYLQLDSHDRTARIELIRLSRYRGDYNRADRLCKELLDQNPADAEALAMRAEVLHWAGHRKLTALRSANEAEGLDPTSPDARVAEVYTLLDMGANHAARQEFAMLRDQVSRDGGLHPDASFHDAYLLLEKELDESSQPDLQMPFSTYNDVDGIHDTFAGLAFTLPVRSEHQFRLNLNQFTSSAPWPGIFTAGRNRANLRQFTVGSTIWTRPGMFLTFAGGTSMITGAGALRPVFNVGFRATPADRWTFEASTGREFLTLTPKAIDRGVSSYQTSGTIRYAFDFRSSFSFQAERRWWSDTNRSIAGAVIFDHVLHYNKHLLLHGGLMTRHDKFDRDMEFASGFFTPDHLQRHESYMGANGEAGLLSWEVRGGGGAQQITTASDFRPSWDVTSSLGIRLARALRIYLNYQRRNYSLLAKDGWYQGFYISLGMKPQI
jgi:tetratricopeptide (TPR) repeat protein